MAEVILTPRAGEFVSHFLVWVSVSSCVSLVSDDVLCRVCFVASAPADMALVVSLDGRCSVMPELGSSLFILI